MNSIWKTFQRRHEEKGITGLETAIILIAFVVVATVFAFVVLTAGIFSSERGKETVYAGLAKARGTMELRGGVVAECSESGGVGTGFDQVDQIDITVANAAGGEPIPLDTGTASNKTIIAFRDAAEVDDDIAWASVEVLGDGDKLLEQGELFTLEVDVSGLTTPLTVNDRFTLEIQTPVGAVLDVTRVLPAQLSAMVQLH